MTSVSDCNELCNQRYDGTRLTDECYSSESKCKNRWKAPLEFRSHCLRWGEMNLQLNIMSKAALYHSTVARIVAAAERASVSGGRQRFVGLGGTEPRPDLLEALAKRHPPLR